jgi:5-methylcytosine-specific restriction endonuclease McrA
MRSTPEWFGKTDDSVAPKSVQLRVILAHDGRCAGPKCGVRFDLKNKPKLDHKIPVADEPNMNRESNLQPLCDVCHKAKTKQEAADRAWVRKQQTKTYGLTKPKSRPMPGTIASGFKRRFDGTVERR